MNFFLRLLCTVLVIMPLVTTTVSVDCDDASLAACDKEITKLSATQPKESTTFCNASKAAIDCEEAFLKECPNFPHWTEKKNGLSKARALYEQKCDDCDALRLEDCDKEITKLSTKQLEETGTACNASKAAMECMEAFLKGCPNSQEAKDKLSKERTLYEGGCRVITIVHAACDDFSLVNCVTELTKLSPEQRTETATLCKATKTVIVCEENVVKGCPNSPILTEAKGELSKARALYDEKCDGVSITPSFLVVLTLSTWSGLRQFL